MFNRFFKRFLDAINSQNDSQKIGKITKRRLQIESLEAREMLSANPLSSGVFDDVDDNLIIYEASSQINDFDFNVTIPTNIMAAVTETPAELTGITLNITAANYNELNNQYDFENITSLTNSTITADGVTLSFSSCTTLSNTNLYAKNGGVIRFSILTSAQGRPSSTYGNQRYWEATGTGSKIEFSTLVSIDSGSLDWSYFYINAKTGGIINLVNVQNISYANFNSNGDGSLIDLSGLPNLSASSSMNLTTGSNGKIKVGTDLAKIANVTVSNFADLIGFDFSKVASIMGLTLSLSNGTCDVSNVTSLTNSTITADGVTLDFSSCTTLSRTNLYVKNDGIINFEALIEHNVEAETTWTATGTGSQLNFSNLTVLGGNYTSWGPTIRAENGGVINFDELIEYNVKAETTWIATGIDSQLNFPKLTTILRGDRNSWDTTVRAENGGTIDLSVLNTLERNLDLYSTGTGSSVDISGIGNVWNVYGTTVSGGGKVNVGTDITKIDNAMLNITDIADLIGFDISKITSITNSSIPANGITYNFTNCTELTNVRLTAQNNGIIRFPKVISYDNQSDITWTANGIGSRIEFFALTTIEGYNGWKDIRAENGGVIDLSALTSISTVRIWSSGTDSIVDISGLSKLAASRLLEINVNSGATVTFADNITELENTTLNLTTLGNFDTNKTLSIKNSNIIANGITYNFTNCTELANVRLTAQNGGIIRFPKVISYDNQSDITWTANGIGSRIEFSALTTIEGYHGWKDVRAENGGVIDLSALTSTSTVRIWSSGTDSIVDISGLSKLAASRLLEINVNSGATVTFANNITELENTTLNLISLGNFDASKITSLKNASITLDGGTLDFINCTILENVNLTVQNGAVIRFPAIIEFIDIQNGSGDITWAATGSGSIIEFANLTKFDGRETNWNYLRVKNGGAILMPKVVSLIDPDLFADNASFYFESCLQLVSANLNVTNGGNIKFPKVTTYNTDGRSYTWSATGTNSMIDLSVLTAIEALTTSVTVSNGGIVNLLNIRRVNHLNLTASGAESEIILPKSVNFVTSNVVINNNGKIKYESDTTITGGLDVGANSTYTTSSDLIISGNGWLQSAEKGVFDVKGNLLGDTIANNYFAVNGTIRFSNGSVQNPQKFEVMGQDKAAVAAGFQNNFAVGRIELTNNTYVLLVDHNDNSAGTGKEALYVKTLVVNSNCTLDLNGYNLYVYGSIINGSVVNGNIIQLSDTGTILYDSPTPGKIGVVGENDQWTFYAQKGESLVATLAVGSGKSALLESPFLNFGEIKLYDPNGNLIKTVSGTSSGQNVTLQFDNLPLNGNYRIDVSAATSKPESVGNYVLTVTPMTLHNQTLPLNKNVTGTLANQYVTDRWVFSVEAGQQINFDLLNRSDNDISFKLTDSTGSVVFDNQTTSRDNISITKSGKYTLSVSKTSDRNGSYAFRVDQTAATPLVLGTSATGTFTGNAYTKVFAIDITESKPLSILLNGYSESNNVRVYAKYGYAPSTTDYDFISTGTTEQSITIPQTHSGKLYVMVVGEYIPQSENFTITAEHKNLIVNNVSSTQFGSGEPITVSITGAGFDKATTVTLISSTGTRYSSESASLENVTTFQATFASTIPAGNYKVEVKNDNSAAITIDNAVTVNESFGQSQFDAKLILPSSLGYHIASTLYIEYTNKGTSAIAAPLLMLQVKDEMGREGAIMSLDAHYAGIALWAANMPEGYSNSIQLYASGATAGVLQPGETITVPIYWNGFVIYNWGGNQNNDNFEFSLSIITPDDTTPLNFTELKTNLKPASMTDAAWDVVFERLKSVMGTTNGDYVKMLNNITNTVSGKNLYDFDYRNIGELFQIALKYANDEFNPFGTLVSSVDAAVTGPNAILSFERTFIGTEISSRFVESDLGYGWDHNWNWKLVTENDGDVVLTGPHGVQRLFQVDARREGTFISSAGDTGSLRLYANGDYTLTESDGTVLRFSSNGLLKSITDTNGNVVTATQSNGKLTKLSDVFGNFIMLTYNADEKITSVKDNFNNTTTYTYDASGKNLVSVTNWQNKTVSYSYATQTTGVLAHTLSSITYADGNVQTFAYDNTGTLITTEVNGIEPVSYIGGKTSKTLLNYDVYESETLVQKLKLNQNGQIAKAEDTQGRMAFFEYDYFGRVTKISDESGNYSTIEYDSRGNIIRSVNSNGEELRFTYSAQYDNLVTLIDSNGNKTIFRYDTRGNLVSMERADGTASGITYNTDGSIAAVMNRRGNSYSYTYDTNGQLAETKPSTAEKPIRYEYDTRGNLIKIIDENDQITTMIYDSNDQLTKVTYPVGKSLEYTYDTFGRQTSMKADNDLYVKYTYNSLGLLEKIIDGLHGDALVTLYTYDSQGRPSKEIQGNGTYTEYTYDELGYLKNLVTYDAGETVLSRFDYTYNAAGLITTSQTIDGQWTYSYDSIGQLTTADFLSTNAGIANQSYVYLYDNAGNRIETVSNGTTIEYVVNNMNQYTKVGDFEYKYDADGNMIQKKNTQTNEVWTFTWSQDGKLISTVSTTGETWSYEYDSFGNRTAVIHDGVRTEYLVDLSGLGNIVAEYDDNGNLVTTYTHGYGLTSQIDSSGNASYYGYDALGSTSIITDASGTVVNHYVYDPFGQSLLKQEGIDNPFQYVGEYGVVTGQHSELVSMRARWYDSNTGRFTSEDPIGLSGGVNLYEYVDNSPIEYIDPSGLKTASVGIQISGGAGIGVSGSVSFVAGDGTFPDFMITSAGCSYAGLGGSLALTGHFTNAESISDLSGWGFETGLSGGELIGGGTGYVAGKGYQGGTVQFGVTLGTPLEVHACATGSILVIRDVIIPTGNWLWDKSKQLWIEAKSLISERKELVASMDPNELLGPGGYGDEGYIQGNTTLPYRINFENDKTATAPAQRVDIVNKLDEKLDLSTFRLTQFGFGDIIVTVPQDASMSRYEQTIELTTETGTLIHVLFISELDYETRTLYVSFESLDPETLLPPSIYDGFLPPEDETGRGMGFISYTIKSNANLVTGDSFNNIARIQFDLGEKIYTNQIDPHDPSQGTNPDLEAWLTIDADVPDSSVLPFDETIYQNRFLVTWNGTDVGSGIASYDIYVSKDDGAFELWLSKTTNTSDIYSGENGYTYSFYSIAYDNVGLVELPPNVADAFITLDYSSEQETPSVVVTTLDDVVDEYDGLISLREAIAYAGTENLGNTITFAESLQNGRMILNGEEIVLDKNITINAVNQNITIDANERSRVFLIAENAEVTLSHLTITGGNAVDGGGIWNKGRITLVSVTISGNTATNGGGIYNDAYYDYESEFYVVAYCGHVILTNCTVSENQANGWGAGIANVGELIVINTLITENEGEGIENDGMSATIINSKIINNRGDGIYNESDLTIVNSLIADNDELGIFHYGDATITNSTITGNGGGLQIWSGTVILNNSIVVENQNQTDIEVTTSPSSSAVIYGVNNLTTFINWEHDFHNVIYNPQKPLFVDAVNGDYRLADNSQANNKGENSSLSEETTTDIAGNPRMIGGTVDIGAYENQGIIQTATMTNINTANHWTVRKNGNSLQIVDADNNDLYSWEFNAIDRLIINASGVYDDELTIDFSLGGEFALENGITFNGSNESRNVLHLIGTNDDDVITINGSEKKLNALAITTQYVYNTTLDGKAGQDNATVVSDAYSNDFILEDNHFNMRGGLYKADVVNVNSLIVFAQGRNDTTLIYAEAESEQQALIGISETRASRVAENQEYHIYYCENVVAINRDIENTAFNTIAVFGVKEIVYPMPDNAVTDNHANFTRHNFDFQIYDFTPDRIILPHAQATASTALTSAQTQASVQIQKQESATAQTPMPEIDPMIAYYAYLADEQLRQRQKQDDLFANTEHWLDEFEDLALLDTQTWK